MGKSAARRKHRTKRAPAGRVGVKPGTVHPLIAQAAGNGAVLDRGAYEVVAVPSPYGNEVTVRDELYRHKAVRRVPHFETLYRTKVITAEQRACLGWYDERLELAEAGLFRSALDVSGNGGGTVHSHITINEVALGARQSIAWARQVIPADCLPAFDAVMVDGFSFVESARRLCAGRYVRVSVRRQRQVARDQFVRAVEALTELVLPLLTETNVGRIRA